MSLAPSEEINTVLMHATFLVSGQKKDDPTKTVFGTVFIMSIPRQDNPRIGAAVLVTARHVLDDIGTDEAVVLVRRRNADGTYQAYPHHIRIREDGKPIYVRHKTADVAVMYVELPTDVPITGVPTDFLVDDKHVEDIDLHPGDEAFCLGFPLAATGPGGFPILRSGHIASYPLTPMNKIGQIDFDLLLYGGNSGGPVYYYYTNRVFKGEMHLGRFQQGVLGLVTQESRSRLPEYSDKPLNFGVVVPASIIRDTISLLRAKP